MLLRSVWLLSLLLCGLMPGVASAQKELKLALDWAYQGNHAFFTLAEDNGHFAKEGLKVKIDRGFGSGDTIAKVAAGTYDFGHADLNLLVPFNAKNPGNKVVCVMVTIDGSLNAIVAKNSAGIRRPKDLEGKRIAAPVSDNSRVLFPIFAKANGVDDSKINWLSVQPNVRDTMLIRGETDAVASVYTTTLLALEAQGVSRNDLTVLRYSELGADLYGFGIIVSEKTLTSSPDVVKGFLSAITRGTRDALGDMKLGIASVKKRDSLLSDSTELARLEMLRGLSILTPSVLANGLGHVDPARMARTLGFVAQSMAITPVPAVRDIYRGEFLPPASERMIRQ
jgi:NitT/TauT family transport system substrate-binding protein